MVVVVSVLNYYVNSWIWNWLLTLTFTQWQWGMCNHRRRVQIALVQFFVFLCSVIYFSVGMLTPVSPVQICTGMFFCFLFPHHLFSTSYYMRVDPFGNCVHSNRESKLNLSFNILIIGKRKLVCYHHHLFNSFLLEMSWLTVHFWLIFIKNNWWYSF